MGGEGRRVLTCAGLFVALALTDLVVLLSSGLENLIAGGVGKLICVLNPSPPPGSPAGFVSTARSYTILLRRVSRAREEGGGKNV